MLDKKNVYHNIEIKLAATLLLVLATAMALSYASGQITKLEKKLTANRQLVYSYQNRLASDSQLKTDLKITKGFEDQVFSSFPPANDADNFINKIETIATANSVTLNVSFSVPKESVEFGNIGISETHLSLSFSGTAKNIQSFVKDFQAMSPYLHIESFTLNSSSPQGWQGQASAQLEAGVYVKDN